MQQAYTFRDLLREYLRDPEFREMWNKYETLKARVLAGEISWDDVDREIDRLLLEKYGYC